MTLQNLPRSADGVRYIAHFAFSPDSHYLAAATENGVVRIWNLNDLMSDPVQLFDYTTAVTGIWFSPNSRVLASAASDGTVRLWNLATRAGVSVTRSRASNVSAPVFNRDATMLAVSDTDGVIHLWRVWLGGDQPALPLHSHAAQALTVAGDEIVIAGSNGMIELRNRSSLALRIRRIGSTYFTAAAATDDGAIVAVADTTGVIAILDPKAGRVLTIWRAEQNAIHDLLFIPNTDLLAVAGAMPAVHVWDWKREELVSTLAEPRNDVAALAYDHNHQRLYGADRDGAVHVWQFPGFTSLSHRQLPSPLVSLAISLDGEQVVVADTDARLYWWPNATAATPIRLSTGSTLRTMAFTPDGRLAAGSDSGELQLWDLASRAAVTIDAHNAHWVKQLWVDPQGERLITIGDDGWMKTWLLNAGALVRLACHRLGRLSVKEEWQQHFDFGQDLTLDPCAGYDAAASTRLTAETGASLSLTEVSPEAMSPLPTVNYYESVNGSHAALNESVVLQWSVENASQVKLQYQGIDNPVAESGELMVSLTEPTTFRLVARNYAGERILTVDLLPDQ